MRLVVIGGSSASTPELIDALTAWPGGSDRRPEMRVVLWGRSTEKLATVLAACRRRLPSDGAMMEVEATAARPEALRGADVVLIQARVGGLAARVFDETFPHRHGLPGDETMGPGGFANALRTVRGLRPIWDDIASEAPGALVVNLTNPAGIVSAAARRSSGLSVVSVCDSPITLTDTIARDAHTAGASPGPDDRDAARARYSGLNHVGWWVPERRLDIAPQETDGARDSGDPTVAFEGAVANPYVRYYLAPRRELDRQRGSEPRGLALRRLERELLDAYRVAGPDVPGRSPRRGAVWYPLSVVPLIDAWLHGSTALGIAGFSNDGLVAGLPRDLTVEVPFRAPGPHRLEPLPPVPLPTLAGAILSAHASYESLALDAILEGGGRDAVVRALWANPMVHDVDLAAALATDILDASPA